MPQVIEILLVWLESETRVVECFGGRCTARGLRLQRLRLACLRFTLAFGPFFGGLLESGQTKLAFTLLLCYLAVNLLLQLT